MTKDLVSDSEYGWDSCLVSDESNGWKSFNWVGLPIGDHVVLEFLGSKKTELFTLDEFKQFSDLVNDTQSELQKSSFISTR